MGVARAKVLPDGERNEPWMFHAIKFISRIAGSSQGHATPTV